MHTAFDSPSLRKAATALFLLGGIIYALGAATRSAVPGMVFDRICAELSVTHAQTAMIASAGVIGCMVFISFSGLLTDRYGWKKMLLPGVCLQVAGEYLVYSSPHLWVIYSGAFINGGGRTILYLTLLKFLDVEFDRRYFSLLIGMFNVFSYGGTFLGTSPFGYLLTHFTWQNIIAASNYVTMGCAGIMLLMFSSFRMDARNTEKQKTKESISFFVLLTQLKRKECFCIFFLTAAGIGIYWSMIAGFANKYSCDLAGNFSAPGIMNLIVMIEMITGGAISCLCGNRRKVFQVAGTLLTMFGLLCLLGGTFFCPASVPVYAGFCLLGAGYGCTGVNICTVREFVPVRYAASAIGFVNFTANVMIVLLTQITGWIFDCFPAHSMSGYRLIICLFLLPSLLAVPCSFLIPDTRGRNVGEKSQNGELQH